MRIVIVHWLDAWYSTLPQQQPHESIRQTTIGFLIEENDSGVLVAMEYQGEDFDDSRYHVFVPWEMIDYVEELVGVK